MTIRNRLTRIERRLDVPPPPTLPMAPDLSWMTVEQLRWALFALNGYRSPYPGVTPCPDYRPSDPAPWEQDPPPDPPEWLPALLSRLRIPDPSQGRVQPPAAPMSDRDGAILPPLVILRDHSSDGG